MKMSMDDSRLKKLGGGGYFRELIERIRDIRATENNIRKTSCQKPYRDGSTNGSVYMHS